MIDKVKLNGNLSLIIPKHYNNLGKQPGPAKNVALLENFPGTLSFQGNYLNLSLMAVGDTDKFNYYSIVISFPIPILKIASFCNFLDQISFYPKEIPQETFKEILKIFPKEGITKSYQFQIEDNLALESLYQCEDIRLDSGDEFIGLRHSLMLKKDNLILAEFNYTYQATYQQTFFSFNQLAQVLRQLISPKETPFSEKDLTHSNPLRRNFAKLAQRVINATT